MHESNIRILGIGTLSFLTGGVAAFYDEIEELRRELEAWEQSYDTDFSDVIAQLDDITTPVFNDVRDGDWYSTYVASLMEWNIVSGYRDTDGNLTGEYLPQNSVTVAESLKMALEAADVDLSQCASIPEHPAAKEHWAKEYVSCAEQNGVRLFEIHPTLDRPVKRAELLTIMHDAFGDSVLPLYANYTDSAGHPYEADIAFASLLGVVSGDTNEQGVAVGTFRPNDQINRAETAKIVYEKIRVAMQTN